MTTEPTPLTPSQRRKAHLILEAHFTPKGGPCSRVCVCGHRVEASCPKELEDMVAQHRRTA